MCQCTPHLRTPFCGQPGCRPPKAAVAPPDGGPLDTDNCTYAYGDEIPKLLGRGAVGRTIEAVEMSSTEYGGGPWVVLRLSGGIVARFKGDTAIGSSEVHIETWGIE